MVVPTTIEAILQLPNVVVCVSGEVARLHGTQGQTWQCTITQCNSLGVLLHVYTPIQKEALFLPWGSVISVEPAP